MLAFGVTPPQLQKPWHVVHHHLEDLVARVVIMRPSEEVDAGGFLHGAVFREPEFFLFWKLVAATVGDPHEPAKAGSGLASGLLQPVTQRGVENVEVLEVLEAQGLGVFIKQGRNLLGKQVVNESFCHCNSITRTIS